MVERGGIVCPAVPPRSLIPGEATTGGTRVQRGLDRSRARAAGDPRPRGQGPPLAATREGPPPTEVFTDESRRGNPPQGYYIHPGPLAAPTGAASALPHLA